MKICNSEFLPSSSGADPGEGHRGHMTPPSEPCQGSQNDVAIGMKILSLSCHFCSIVK